MSNQRKRHTPEQIVRKLGQADRLLGEGDCYCWVVAVVPENFRDATVNLKSPVYLNTTTQKGAQIILEGDYPVRFPIAKGGES